MGRILQYHGREKLRASFEAQVWELGDFDALARAIADLALGQWRHVEALLKSASEWGPISEDYAIDSAINSLTVTTGSDPWHRDGWVFQLISWIAAVEADAGPVRAPQMDQASKGFDGLQLIFDTAGANVSHVLIFEDKATDSPRDTVRDDVWPSFRNLEEGQRNSALSAEVASLLDRVPGIDVPKTVDRIMREPAARAYRVSVTAKSFHADHETLRDLFKGFDEAVAGEPTRRRANVFKVEDLRPWMKELCTCAIELLEGARSCSTP
ncbi:hypothetical protein [Homoserinimonas hongtaonis]|uniref:DUF1837 domain-containing protein n=1 Tax=Homoserinimonas hongtaonis TaxID=2079791 RepID=A0A2U1T2X1_9MICO|nr:hypothetical protein [Salinibacterium hongtaonis]PWB98222.1 hypothetical protein DF220_10570 [Salinibacterium hongtaonis]